MHFLLTGGTGFIGRAVVAAAEREGHRVTTLARPKDDIATFVPQEKYDALIHLAWGDVGKYADPQNLLKNLEPQFLFLQRMIDTGLRDITVAGTCFEYGMAEGVMRESAAAQPATFYGLAKATLYQMLAMTPDLCLKWPRFFYVYGRGQRPQSLLSQLLAAIERKDAQFDMSQGEQVRDFIHIDTLAHNVVKIAAQRERTGIINVGSGAGARVVDFVDRIRDIKGSGIVLNRGFYPYSAFEPFSFVADIQKLKSIPGARFDDQIKL